MIMKRPSGGVRVQKEIAVVCNFFFMGMMSAKATDLDANTATWYSAGCFFVYLNKTHTWKHLPLVVVDLYIVILLKRLCCGLVSSYKLILEQALASKLLHC